MLHILVLHFLQCCTGAWPVVEVGVSVVGTTTTLARGRDLVGRGGGHSSSSVVVTQPQFWYIEHPPRPFHGSIQAIFRTKRLIDLRFFEALISWRHSRELAQRSKICQDCWNLQSRKTLLAAKLFWKTTHKITYSWHTCTHSLCYCFPKYAVLCKTTVYEGKQ